MNTIRHEVLPASGVEFAASLKLTPDALVGVRYNVVVARSNVLRVFEVREHASGQDGPTAGEKAMDGVEGAGGQAARIKTRFHLLREHRLHGTVTGLERVRTLASNDDDLDRLLVSFRDAKIALLEWSEETYDLLTVSLHTYERAPQLLSLEAPLHRAQLRVDPLSRVAALTLPQDALALLPFHASQLELDALDADTARLREVPYAPSFVLSLPSTVDTRLRNVRDAAFLPGLSSPTLAVLCAPAADACAVLIFGLGLGRRAYPVLAAHEGLPVDAEVLVPCPAHVGGALVLGPSGLVHLGASARRVALAEKVDLAGARAAFVGSTTALIVDRDGTSRVLTLAMDGPALGALTLGPPVAQTPSPTLVRAVGKSQALLGSITGDSVLINVDQVEAEDAVETATETVPPPQEQPKDGMELDEDAELYGDSGPETVVVRVATPKRTTTRLSLADTIPGYGAIADMTVAIAKNGDKLAPELLAATGSGPQAGFTLFQRDLPVRLIRKLHALGGARGVWALPLRSADGGLETLLLSTDLTPTPGLSRIATRGLPGDIAIQSRAAGATVGCGAFFGGTALVQVLPNALRVLERDGAERQLIKDVDGPAARARIRAAAVCDPYAAVLRADGTLGLFVAADARKLRRKDMSALGDKSARYDAVTFFADRTGVFGVKDAVWIVLVRPQSVLEIWALPKLTLMFSSATATTLPPAFGDSMEPRAPPVVGPAPDTPEPDDVEQVLIAPLGETDQTPHLLILLRSGHLGVYVLRPVDVAADAPRGTLPVRFVSRLRHVFAARTPAALVPFVSTRHAGVFLTGERPAWVLAPDVAGALVHPAAHGVVHAFTYWEHDEFVLYTDEGPCLVEWMPNVDVRTALPSRRVHMPRAYTHVAYEPMAGLVVGAASLHAQFASYDEDGALLWEPDGSDMTWPMTDCSTLELMGSNTLGVMDGYEFASNEFVTALALVSLETQSTEAGFKEFVAVATTIDRGEDLAVRGAVYIFDIAEVVVAPDEPRRYKLRLMCKDDAKGPVTALCGMNGYLVSSMGQKLYVRAFDRDERLVGVAFLDVGVYVSSLRALKNLLVVGDAVKSVWLVAFQEEPFKLVVISKDVRRHAVARADLFFSGATVAVVAGDEDGVLRMYAYDPADPESKNGQELVYKTEFHTHSECRASLTIARRSEEGSAVPQGKLLCGHLDGALSTLTPVDDAAFKRLQLLQGQLVGKIQHVAGLNPRAFRLVRNDFFSKPLAKGIIDANLLEAFLALPVSRQDEFTKQIGTDKETVLRDYLALRGVW